MNKKAPEILQLRLDIEQSVGRRMRTPYDFEFLVGAIWERLHENISPTTLKRLWGYIDGADVARYSTLSLLASFLGYSDWEHYLLALSTRSDVESQVFPSDGIHVSDLEVGNRVEVAWLPNRHCVFRYEGNNTFTVVESQNAKLQVGDTFTCSYFFVGQPMYLDGLVQAHSFCSPIAYVAGSKGGLTSVSVL